MSQHALQTLSHMWPQGLLSIDTNVGIARVAIATKQNNYSTVNYNQLNHNHCLQSLTIKSSEMRQYMHTLEASSSICLADDFVIGMSLQC